MPDVVFPVSKELANRDIVELNGKYYLN